MNTFVLGSTCLVFASLVEVVITSALAKAGKIDDARRIDNWCRVVFPVILFALLGAWFLL